MKTPIASERPDVASTMPAVSPDGHSVVFEQAGELYILDLKDDLTRAGKSRRITDVALAAMQPTWAPSGKEIVFSAQRSLWRMDVSGARSPERVSVVGDGAFMPVLARAPSGPSMRLVYVRNWTDANIWRLNMTAPDTPAWTVVPHRATNYAWHELIRALSGQPGDHQVSVELT